MPDFLTNVDHLSQRMAFCYWQYAVINDIVILLAILSENSDVNLPHGNALKSGKLYGTFWEFHQKEEAYITLKIFMESL